ncbi:MAG: ComF family protein [Clostridia bacterium]|nr:ComF family protein [Clostridia bacterium]
MFCKKVLKINHRLPNICPDCNDKVLWLPLKTCVRCGKPTDAGYDKPYCLYCAKKITGIKGVVSPLLYKDETRESILRFKFGNKPYYAATYANLLYERLKEYKLENSFEKIVPVPITFKRLFKRGYNQSMRTAKYMSKLSGKPVLNALKKIKDTPPQSTLKFSERKNNLKDAIIMKKNIKPVKSVLLIDDVYTTGTTAKVCSTALHKGGIPRVLVCTIAMHLPSAEETD